MLFMVIEKFPLGPRPVYERVVSQGRSLPDGLRYVDSWVDEKLDRCFQLMECDDPSLLEEWADSWHGLVEFEFVHVVTSDEARRRALARAT